VNGVPAAFAPDFNVIDGEMLFFTAATPYDFRNRLECNPKFGSRIRIAASISQDCTPILLHDVTCFDFDRSTSDAQNRSWSETQELALAR
jgi:hypothetical protein